MIPDGPRPPHSDEIRQLVLEQIEHDLAHPRRRWWQTLWGRVAIVAGAMLIVSPAVAAVILLQPKPVTDTTIVHCLYSDQRAPDGSLPGLSVGIATPTGQLDINDAISTCKEAWASGGMTSTDKLSPTQPPGAVPVSFTECVNDRGEAVIVPARVECSGLKLHPYHP